MSKPLKVIGIVLGVLVLILIVAAPLFFGFFGRGFMPMMGGYRNPHGHQMLWFFGGWAMMLGRLLFPLLAIGLLVWGGFALGKNASRRSESHAAPVTGPSPASIAPRAPDLPGATAAAAKTCARCGGEVQEGWVACPHCGEKI